MTLPINTSPTENYLGDGTQHIFSFNFRMLTDDNIKVTAYDADGVGTPLEIFTDFTVDFKLFPQLGGNVTLINTGAPYIDVSGNLKDSWNLFIEYIPVLTQPRRFRDYGPTAPLEIEKAEDQVVMDILAIWAKLNRALTIPGGGGTVNPELPPLVGNARKILRVADDESGYVLGPSVDSIFQALADAQAAADDAALAAVAADGSASAAANSAISAANQVALAANQVTLAVAQVGLANTARAGAETAEANAVAQVALAAAQVTVAQGWANLSKQYAETTLYSNVVSKNAAVDSPYSITIADKDRIFNVDASTANMTFVLPDMSTMPADFKFAVVKRDPSMFSVIINSAIVDTINGQPSVSINAEAYGYAVRKVVPGTDWNAKYFMLESSGGGGTPSADVYNISAAPQLMANGDKVVLIGGNKQFIKVQGNGAPVTADAAVFSTAAVKGAVITLEGQDDTNYVMIPHSDTAGGCINPGKGDIYLLKNTTVTYMYDIDADRYKSLAGNGI